MTDNQMTDNPMTIDDLKRILRQAAGEAEGADLDGDILDTEFADLGYDSIALMETGGRIQRERGIQLDDDTMTSAHTPRALLALVNERLARVG
jgi:act minimal PKS acyl carrier protein